MIKAYAVSCDTYDGLISKITFSESANKAKASRVGDDGFEDIEYIDLHCKRVPWADKYVDSPLVDLQIAELEHGLEFWIETFGCWIDEEDIGLVKHYGGIEELVDAIDEGKVAVNEDGELFPTKDANINEG